MSCRSAPPGPPAPPAPPACSVEARTPRLRARSPWRLVRKGRGEGGLDRTIIAPNMHAQHREGPDR
eukprot:1434705-Prymnesium_polylepis.1